MCQTDDDVRGSAALCLFRAAILGIKPKNTTSFPEN